MCIFKMLGLGAIHFISYINRSIAKKVCLVARGGREPVTYRSLRPTLSLYTTHVNILEIYDVCMILILNFIFYINIRTTAVTDLV